MHRIRLLAGLLVAPLVAAACGDATTTPADTLALSHEISSGELGQALNTAPARIEIKLERGTLVAHEVELKTSDEMSDEESVRGLVTTVSVSGTSGTLTFEIDGLEVTFASSARFRADHGENLTFDEFVTLIENTLAAGAQPSVRAKRSPPAEPQAPDDATFEATDLRIQNGLKSPKLELNVDADNYEENNAPPPVAWVRVLGLEIEILSTTEIGEDDDHNEETEVHGIVASVDVGAGSATLDDGTVILIPDAGAFEDEGEDDDEHLPSLEAVAQALADGLTVKAEAEGAVQSTDPLTIAAREVEFEIANGDDDGDDDDGQQQGQTVEFESIVQSVDVGAGLFILGNGVTVKLGDATEIVARGDLASLQAVADALTAGKTVEAEGRAVVESQGPPLTLVAVWVKWKLDD